MKKTCETCAAFDRVYEGGIGQCMLNPPVLKITAFSLYNGTYGVESVFDFPEVHESEWCLQWRKKEDEEKE